MTIDATSTRTTSGPWKDYASFMLEELAAQGRIVLAESRTITAISPGPVPVVLLARNRDANWALDQVERIISTEVA